MTIAGSNMYGTNTAESDIDKRGVCVPPKNVLLGFARNFEQQEVPGEDTTIFSLKKFIDLAASCNPNIIELLYAPKDCVQTSHDTWKELLKHRDKFLSAEAFVTFCGYATSQLKRIQTHRGWLLNPPTEKPRRADYGLEETGSGFRELVKGIDITEIDPKAVGVIKNEKRYKSALDTWNQYENWKRTRNPKRAALEATYGYDCKHAGHLVRLLRMLKQVLLEGTLTVRRSDAKELLEIRNGKWSYQELMEQTDALKAELTEIFENKKYVVPRHSNKLELSDLCAELHEFHWRHHAQS